MALALSFGCAFAEPPRRELTPGEKAKIQALKAEQQELYTAHVALDKGLYYQGAYAKAEKGLREATAWFEAELGAEHAKSLDARRYLFHALEKQGKHAAADEVRRASPALGDVGIPDTLSAALTPEQRIQGNLALARSMLTQAERKSGPEAPETLERRMTLVQRLYLANRLEEAEQELRELHEGQARVLGASSPKAIDSLRMLRALQSELGSYRAAVRSAAEMVQIYESDPATFRAELPSAYLILSWQQLLARDFEAVLDSTSRGREWDGSYFALDSNRAHALLFLGRVAEARALYATHSGQQVFGRPWGETLLADLDQLEAAGLAHPELPALRELLRAQPARAAR